MQHDTNGVTRAIERGFLRRISGEEVNFVNAPVLLQRLGIRAEVTQSADEAEVLFTLMAERYERRSLLITSNLVFSEWGRIFKSPMTTAAAIDRLVHHATILEIERDSIRAEDAQRRGGKRRRDEKEGEEG